MFSENVSDNIKGALRITFYDAMTIRNLNRPDLITRSIPCDTILPRFPNDALCPKDLGLPCEELLCLC